MSKHRGHILEIAIRGSGKPIAEISEKLGITRSTLYKKFEMIDLNDSFLKTVGKTIDFDFSTLLPELTLYKRTNNKETNDNWEELGRNYTSAIEKSCIYEELLHKYRILLNILLRTSVFNKSSDINNKISNYMENVLYKSNF